MRAILCDPGYVRFVAQSAVILDHILTCEDCQARADSGKMPELVEIMDGINSLGDNDIDLHDYLAALAFCHYWLDMNGAGPTRH
jgi:hypothetical protein